jgi:prepilin-type N-terminal cleavage/methylation domain-containing protein
MKKESKSNRNGFTLIEVIASMVIIGVMASVSAQKFDLLSDTANVKAINEGIRELNIRESLTWTNIKLSDSGYNNDEALFEALETNLGGEFGWTDGPTASGGTLKLRSITIVLSRTPSTIASVGRWESRP